MSSPSWVSSSAGFTTICADLSNRSGRRDFVRRQMKTGAPFDFDAPVEVTIRLRLTNGSRVDYFDPALASLDPLDCAALLDEVSGGVAAALASVPW
jgi:hypothetical protein